MFATCRRLGIETVAVHSDADAELPFVREADVAVRLPGNTPAETYLRADLVHRGRADAGADAIHPGYGFLSENADFARAVDRRRARPGSAPARSRSSAMGSKIEAKKLMARRRRSGARRDRSRAATEDDLPLLVKASAGGGGRGMRVVRDARRPARARSRRREAEAASAFGDGTVFVEPYLEHGRHVEVQVRRRRHGSVLVARRARLLDPAPPPEGGRGGAGARRRADGASERAARGGRARPPRRSATSAPAPSSSSTTPSASGSSSWR